MPRPDTIAIGASAGGLYALSAILAALHAPFDACLLVVMHSATNGSSVLPDMLARTSSLPVALADDGEPLTPGRVFVARPDAHLLVVDDRMRLVRGPRENGFRPAVDPLFRTAAWERKARVIGVVLSGALSDGTYAPDNHDAAQREATDGALWSAVRVFEEHAELKLRMARRAAAAGLSAVSAGFEEGVRDARRRADRIRELLVELPMRTGGPDADGPDAIGRPRPSRRARMSSSRRAGARQRRARR